MRLPRVSKRNPCPICGHDHWCYFLNEHTVVCMRVPSDRPKRASGFGGYIHRLDGSVELPAPAPAFESPRAAPAVLDRVYRAFLAQPELFLALDDYRKFSEWKLPVEFVKRQGYRRLPLKGRAEVCRRLLKDGYGLEGVPGFYARDGFYGPYWTFTTGPGLIFPSISPDGKIQGLQVRLDDPRGGGKYLWFSSSDLPGGASSGAPWHVARPAQLVRRVVIITEGIRKADVVAWHMGALTIGLGGVAAIEGVSEHVKSLGMPALVAYDMDILKKAEVFESFRTLIGKLTGNVFVAAWDPKHKGLDDLLMSGGWPKIIPVSEAMREIARARKKLSAPAGAGRPK